MRWLVAGLIVYTLVIAWMLTPRPPTSDGYARYALGLHDHGVYGRVMTPGIPPPADMGRAPLYPALLAAGAALYPTYHDYLHCFYSQQTGCDAITGLTAVRGAQMALGIIGLLAVYGSARVMGAGYLPGLMMTGLLGGLWLPYIYLNGYSEAIGLPLHAALTYFTTRYLFKPTPKRDALIIGGLIGLLALTRFAYLYYLPLALLVLWLGRDRTLARRLSAWRVGLALVGAVAVLLPWMLRNQVEFDTWSIGNSGSGGVVHVRLQMNQMTISEYPIAFLYWFPYVGEPLAETALPDTLWSRFDVDAPDGFRQSGIRASQQAEAGTTSLLLADIQQNPVAHVAVSVPLAVRGLKYAVLFLPLMPFFFYYVIRREHWRVLLALSAGWFVWIFHAGFTHFNVRYGWPLGFDFAVATALAATWLYADWRRRTDSSATPQTE
jgi:4-amino-4-deoxy-L-arabinose transferase-like glycosyltransferase